MNHLLFLPYSPDSPRLIESLPTERNLAAGIAREKLLLPEPRYPRTSSMGVHRWLQADPAGVHQGEEEGWEDETISTCLGPFTPPLLCIRCRADTNLFTPA